MIVDTLIYFVIGMAAGVFSLPWQPKALPRETPFGWVMLWMIAWGLLLLVLPGYVITHWRELRRRRDE